MKGEARKMKKLVVVLGLCVFCILAGVVTSANTPEISAQTAYQKLMNKYKKSGFQMYVKYDAEDFGAYAEAGYPSLLSAQKIRDGRIKYMDLNGDRKKECILVTEDYINLFTMKGTKVKYLGGIHISYMDGVTHKGKAKEFTFFRYGGKMMHYYTFRIKNAILTKVCTFGDQVLNYSNGDPYHEYYYNDKRTSTRKYKSTYRKYATGGKELSLG